MFTQIKYPMSKLFWGASLVMLVIAPCVQDMAFVGAAALLFIGGVAVHIFEITE